MDRNLLERVIKRLEEKDLIDHEVMEAAELESLRSDIAALKRFRTHDSYTVTINCHITKDRF